jgi:gliding motility-associated-like protein
MKSFRFSNSYSHRLCFVVAILLLITEYGFAQKSDTIYLGSKVIIRSNIIVTYDSAEFRKLLVENRIDSEKIVVAPKRFSTGSTQNLRIANDCGVKASFNPPGDSSFTSSFYTTFYNTSTNATSVNWFVNGINNGNGNSISVSFPVGVWQIKLVASNNNCTDTSIAYYFNSGIAGPDHKTIISSYGLPSAIDNPTGLTGLKKGGYILTGGSYIYYGGQYEKGLLIKVKDSGCIEWTKILDSRYGAVESVQNLQDGGFLVAGGSYYIDTYLVRFDQDGNVKWKKSYQYHGLIIHKTFELSDGSIIALGSDEGTFSGCTVLKLDAQGNLLWNKYYKKSESDFAYPLGVAEYGNNIFVSGNLANPNQEAQYNSEYNKDGFIVCLNSSSGATNWSKNYGAAGYSDFFQDIHVSDQGLLVNSVRTNYLGGSNVIPDFHFLDFKGNIRRSYKVSNSTIINYPFYSAILPLKDNKFYLAHSAVESINLQPGYINHTYFLKLDTLANISWRGSYLNRMKLIYYTAGAADELAALGTMSGSLLFPYSSISDDFLFAKIDSSGSYANNCYLGDNQLTILPDQVNAGDLHWLTDSSLAITTGVPIIDFNTTYAQSRNYCPEYIDSCSFLKVEGPKSLCNLTKTYVFRAYKNVTCFQPVEWSFSPGVQVVSSNNSMAEVKFLSYGTFKVSALLANGCTPIKDSFYVVAGLKTSVVTLGTDTSLCVGNSLLLRPGSQFLSYKWQDGSTDSIIEAKDSGTYWVQVIDSCLNLLADTIHISRASAITMNAGPDRSLCEKDSIQLNAPVNFLHYLWSGSSDNLMDTTSSIIISPAADSYYYIRAEKSAGCFGYDTIRVSVYHPPLIDLGRDTSFCKGGSVTLNAGAGFTSYLWNDGSSLQKLTTSSAASYMVTGFTAEGCKSYDTVTIANVYNLPVVRLDPHPVICAGETITLDAGNFNSYQWNTGNSSRSILIRDSGTYQVNVTDANGCKGYDWIKVSTVQSLPSNFLPPDTSICSYSSIVAKSNRVFDKYLWNNNSESPFIVVSRAGIYWLQVTDNYGCTGTDTLLVKEKQCMTGLYVPSAFSPNSDGKNDLFKPLLFGNIKKMHFTVYNRWGQVVFSTDRTGIGWDGKLQGVEQRSDVFVWICQYQLEGETEKIAKGTVLVIR